MLCGSAALQFMDGSTPVELQGVFTCFGCENKTGVERILAIFQDSSSAT